ncbi:hypothetical protein K503DRAFT_818209 [Rhizopogon vinicolor AM-OR11-026]|uniref:Uncharacterized protein n=1 Tax=Rhizopogon vinicolor AM-OR11-026 TaxID=1314800 RepID=A0A1B7N095_9AGAM|nr:hypothetical protein K503DRAFT_818209 [Rhizopogon vinicolor AM-OR11-026]
MSNNGEETQTISMPSEEQTQDRASKRGRNSRRKDKETETRRENRESANFQEAKVEGVKSGNGSETEDDEQRIVKRAKNPLMLASSPGVDNDPWHLPLYRRISERPISSLRTSPLIQNPLSKAFCPLPDVHHLRLANGSMSFDGKLDPKQTHIIDDKVELAFRVTKSCGSIKSSSDHNTTFNMYIEATGFVFPQRAREFARYHTDIHGEGDIMVRG